MSSLPPQETISERSLSNQPALPDFDVLEMETPAGALERLENIKTPAGTLERLEEKFGSSLSRFSVTMRDGYRYHVSEGVDKFSADSEWYKFAAGGNMPVAFVFEQLAEEISALDDSESGPDIASCRPFFHLKRRQVEIGNHWRRQLKEAQHAFFSELPVDFWVLEFRRFSNRLPSIRRWLNILDVLMIGGGVDVFYLDDGIRTPDPGPAQRAASRILDDLTYVLHGWKDLDSQIRERAMGAKTSSQTGRDDGLRRRKLVPSASDMDDHGSDENDERVSRQSAPPTTRASVAHGRAFMDLVTGWVHGPDRTQSFREIRLPLAAHLERVYRRPWREPWPSRQSVLRFGTDHSTLWAIYPLIFVLSAIMGIVAILQDRPNACTPATAKGNRHDDGFWMLLSQLFLQVLALYCTVLPLVRDRSLPVRPFWFCTWLAASALASVLAPLVYGIAASWKIATGFSWLSGAFALMATGQLVGSIQQVRSRDPASRAWPGRCKVSDRRPNAMHRPNKFLSEQATTTNGVDASRRETWTCVEVYQERLFCQGRLMRVVCCCRGSAYFAG